MEQTIKQHARWGIAGPGSIARRFAAQLTHSQTGELVAVASQSSPERAREFAAAFEKQPEGIRVHDSYEALFADPGVDAIYVSTVHTAHVRLAIQALDAGKHVVVEKPLSVVHAGAMAGVEAARRNHRYLAEAFMYRFHPQTYKLRELVESGAIGEVQHIEASFAFRSDAAATHRLYNSQLAGGGILDVGGYPVSVARLIAGAATRAAFADPVSLSACGTVGATGVDEWATASLVFASGITAHVTSGVRLSENNRIVVSGSRGQLVIDEPWLHSVDTSGADEGSVIEVRRVDAPAEHAVERISVDSAYQYALQADAVAEYAEAGQCPQMSWADSLGNAHVLDEWREAIGLQYPFEAPTANIPPLSGRAPMRRPNAVMPTGRIPGIDKDVSRLIMGVDNQRTLGHASAMFDDFVERGGNAFDTAYIYGGGSMERLLGQWIANRACRDDVVVVGKGAHTPHCDPDSIVRQLDESLDRLQTDYVDLYLMHRDNEQIPVGEFVDALDEQAKAGRIRAFGGSNWSIARFQEALDYAQANGRQGFVVLSDHFGLAHAIDVPWKGCRHVTDRTDREWLERTGVTLLPWSSQARGFFARADRADRSDEELVRCYYSDENFERLERARTLADEFAVAPTAVALAYVLAQSFPTFPLIGPRTIEETRTSMAGLEITLTDQQLRWLDLRD